MAIPLVRVNHAAPVTVSHPCVTSAEVRVVKAGANLLDRHIGRAGATEGFVRVSRAAGGDYDSWRGFVHGVTHLLVCAQNSTHVSRLQAGIWRGIAPRRSLFRCGS